MTSSLLSGFADRIGNPETQDIGARFDKGTTHKLAGQILSKSIGGLLGGGLVGRLTKADPTVAANLFKAVGIPMNQVERMQSLIGDNSAVVAMLRAGQIKEAKTYTAEKVLFLEGLGIEPTQYLEVAQGLNSDDPNIVEQTIQAQYDLNEQFISSGLAKTPKGVDKPGEQRTFEALIANMTPEQQAEARQIKAGLKPRAVGNSTLTAIQQEQLDALVAAEERLAGGKETGKLRAQLVLLPQIRAKVKLAEAEATERGEVFTDLSRMNAALPGLKETVGKLKELAKLATSTFGGRVYDAAIKETGFGATKGATARAKFIAIVANQILPLLKPTFGAAFTVPEGDALKATLGDPNASEEEKIAQLEAFMEQKERTIREKEAQLSVQPTSFNAPADESQGVEMVDAQGNRALVNPKTGQVIREL